jgi:transposase
MDEARFGTHSKQGHGWFATGKRSSIAIKLGYKNFYVYSSVEPKTGEVFSLVLPKVNTEIMNLYLQEMAEYYKGEEIVLILDGAGWHKSKGLIIPKNITILHLPPYSPELNPVERFWLYVKSNVIRNKIFDSLEELENDVCNFLNVISSTSVAQICNIDWFN